jgi:hypothetical protein
VMIMMYRVYLHQLRVNVNTKEEQYFNNYIRCLSLPCHMRKVAEDIDVTGMDINIESHTFQRHST